MIDYAVIQGDCREVMRTLGDCSVDSIVADPPYEIGMMGRSWDRTGIAYDIDVWREALRVLKPGGYLLSFGGTRTYHRMACAIEDAGFEIRDCAQWWFGSGFPKSLDVSKAIDREAGAEREKILTKGGLHNNRNLNDDNWSKIGLDAPMMDSPIPATPAAKQWEGWHTALKPSYEPCVMARKPLVGTVAQNVLKYGTGAINVGACRVVTDEYLGGGLVRRNALPGDNRSGAALGMFAAGKVRTFTQPTGRWPANLLHDGSEAVTRMFPETGPSRESNRGLQQSSRHGGIADLAPNIKFGTDTVRGHDDAGGSAARFFQSCQYDAEDLAFYCAKASREDRDEGLNHLPEHTAAELVDREADSAGIQNPRAGAGRTSNGRRNTHPTVKPTPLMQYLCRLVTPPGGIVLDPFCGSGSTGKAAILEGFKFIGAELDAGHVEIALGRIAYAASRPRQMDIEQDVPQATEPQEQLGLAI